MNSLIGQQLGPYRILREIGRGGMAVVYEALDTRHNRPVALKVLPPYFQHDIEFLHRFLAEAQRTVSLRHPHIVETYEAGHADGYYYIAMEYMEGGSLTTRLRTQTRLSLEEATTVLSQIAAALDHAHNQGLIHRDVKPSNILFDQSGQAKLADFGIAKAADQATVTLPGTLVGTPEYMSPEQGQGRPVDERTDVWSLGVVLYQMLTGRLPFVGDNPHAVLYQVVRQRPRPATSLNPKLPKAVDSILDKALEKSPRRRYRRSGEMAGALRQIVHGATEAPTILKKAAEPPTRKLVRQALPKVSPLASAAWAIFGGLGAALLVLLLVLRGVLGPRTTPTWVPTPTIGGLVVNPVAVTTIAPTVIMIPFTQTPGVPTSTPTPTTSPSVSISPTPLVLRWEGTGTLRNIPEGFRLEFINVLTAITVQRVTGFTVDEEAIPLEEIHIRTPVGREATAAQISPERSLHIGRNTLVSVEVIRKPLTLGPHEIKLAVFTEEMGYIQITFTDIVKATPPPAVTATGTAIPSPTPRVTQLPTTTVAPTSTPVPEAAITLIQPANGERVRDLVTFRWEWPGALGPGEIFDVRVCKDEGDVPCQPRFGKTNVGETTWKWLPDAGTGVYRWQVLVIDGESKQDKGPRSAVWSFEWLGGGGPPPGPSPTSTPR